MISSGFISNCDFTHTFVRLGFAGAKFSLEYS